MSGTIPLSMTQQFDEFGRPLKGGQLFLIQAGTVSTPQDGFQDPSLTIKLPYPITLDAAGRIPQIFLADGFIKIRLQDAKGVVQLASDGIQVIGPSGSGGGGGTPVDPNALIQMGNMIFRYGIGVLGGYVRLNNLTIGSALSGATERANADCQNLFQYLWGVDPSLVVSGGRGASAAADWAANKQLATPDWRGYALGALDDMGNVAAGRLSPAFFGSSPLILGAFGGGESFLLSASHIPAAGLSVSGTTGPDSPLHTHVYDRASGSGNSKPAGAGTTPFDTNTPTPSSPPNVTHAHAFNANVVGGGGQALRTIGPRKLCTFYIKL